MKKKDIIKLVKKSVQEVRGHYGQHDYYGNNVGGRNSISGMPGVWEQNIMEYHLYYFFHQHYYHNNRVDHSVFFFPL